MKEVSKIKHILNSSCSASFCNLTLSGSIFKYWFISLWWLSAASRFNRYKKVKREVLRSVQLVMCRLFSKRITFARWITIFSLLISGSLIAAPTIHERLLASDPVLREADAVHSAVYRRLRSSLDNKNQQQLKAAQIRWIDSLNQSLAQTPASQQEQVALKWTQERTKSLNGFLELRNESMPNDITPELPKPYPQTQNTPEEIPDQVQQVETKFAAAASALITDIAKHWKREENTSQQLPECLPSALVDRLEQLVPWSKIDHSAIAKGRYSNLKIAYAVHHCLITKPLNLSAAADFLEQAKDLNLQDVPWVSDFRRTLEARVAKALTLQEEALGLMKGGDTQAAEARMQQAAKEYQSTSLTAYSSALSFYNRLVQDKALRAVDGDWKNPSLPDKDLFSITSKQAAALRIFEGKEVSTALSSIAKGYDAAAILWKFTSDFEPAGDLDKPHPIRAIQALRKSESYREMKSNKSFFTEPFIERLKFLEELIGKKTRDYERLVEQAAALENESKYLDAATSYRLALGMEYSKELEQTIHSCEAKISGL